MGMITTSISYVKKLEGRKHWFWKGGKIPEGKNEGIIYCENSHDFNSEVLIYFGITACLTCFTQYIYIYIYIAALFFTGKISPKRKTKSKIEK
jgi:hypothetical protein